MKNFILSIVSILSFMSCNDTKAQVKAVTSAKLGVEAFEKLIKTDKNVQLVDVRTPQEVTNGYIANAVNINSADADFQAKLGRLDKSKPVAVYCAVGGRSGRAATILTQMGFKTIYDLEGGMTAWKSQNKPIIKK
jgi:rhodanese-related sulfurtransferase